MEIQIRSDWSGNKDGVVEIRRHEEGKRNGFGEGEGSGRRC